MKIIVKGKLYDTETSNYLCQYDTGASDFRNPLPFTDTLYRTRKGNYFIIREIAAKSKPECYPITAEDAKKFIEQHATTEEWIAFFGEPEEA